MAFVSLPWATPAKNFEYTPPDELPIVIPYTTKKSSGEYLTVEQEQVLPTPVLNYPNIRVTFKMTHFVFQKL
jgi:hypothetical protein